MSPPARPRTPATSSHELEVRKSRRPPSGRDTSRCKHLDAPATQHARLLTNQASGCQQERGSHPTTSADHWPDHGSQRTRLSTSAIARETPTSPLEPQEPPKTALAARPLFAPVSPPALAESSLPEPRQPQLSTPSSDDLSPQRLVSYRLDTTTSLSVSREDRRLVSAGAFDRHRSEAGSARRCRLRADPSSTSPPRIGSRRSDRHRGIDLET
jgi:hypothetical protein